MKTVFISNPQDISTSFTLLIQYGDRIIVVPDNFRIVSKTVNNRIPLIFNKLNTKLLYKYCSKCNKWLPVDLFSKNSHAPDGYKNDCRNCNNKNKREKYKESVAGKKALVTDTENTTEKEETNE
jgi:hypothetical protein